MNRRARWSEAAATVRECRAAFAAGGSSAVCQMVGGGEAAPWRHYPEGEVYDPTSHAQYFFHHHPGRPGEHTPAEIGHFHLFLRGEAVPAGIAPLLLPDATVANAPLPGQSAPLKRGGCDEVCHLVAIAVDHDGEPVRLFTTNRWVTGETWYAAEDMIRMLDRFRVAGDQPPALVGRWLTALIRLFQDDIASLLLARDRTVRERRWRWRSNVLEDPRLEITSSLPVDLAARLAEVERGADVRPPVTNRRAHLPPMAEGWGA